MAFGLLMKCGLTLTEWDRWQRLRGTDAKPDAARCFCSRDASSTLWRKKSALPRGRRSFSRSPLDAEATGPETWCLEVNLPFICPAGILIISRNGVSLIYLKPSNCGATTYAPAHHVSQSIHQDDTLSSRVPHTEALQVCHTVKRHHGGPGSAVWHTTVWHSPVTRKKCLRRKFLQTTDKLNLYFSFVSYQYSCNTGHLSYVSLSWHCEEVKGISVLWHEIRDAPLFLDLCVEEQRNGVNVKKKAHVSTNHHTSGLLPALPPLTLTSTFAVILLLLCRGDVTCYMGSFCHFGDDWGSMSHRPAAGHLITSSVCPLGLFGVSAGLKLI